MLVKSDCVTNKTNGSNSLKLVYFIRIPTTKNQGVNGKRGALAWATGQMVVAITDTGNNGEIPGGGNKDSLQFKVEGHGVYKLSVIPTRKKSQTYRSGSQKEASARDTEVNSIYTTNSPSKERG